MLRIVQSHDILQYLDQGFNTFDVRGIKYFILLLIHHL